MFTKLLSFVKARKAMRLVERAQKLEEDVLNFLEKEPTGIKLLVMLPINLSFNNVLAASMAMIKEEKNKIDDLKKRKRREEGGISMERELAKQKLQEALEGMNHEEKYDVLTDVLQAEDKILLSTWFLGEAIIAAGAKKATVVLTKDCTCTLTLHAASGKSLHLGRKV